LSDCSGEIVALAWISFSSRLYLLVGFEYGCIACYDVNLDEIFAQTFHEARILKIQTNHFVTSAFKAVYVDVVVVYEGSIVVFIEGEHIQNLILESGSGLRVFKWVLDFDEVLDCSIYGG
jgi:hypothetical protein